jgi:hypothetical protein
VKREPVPRRLAAEASLWRALLDLVLQKDRRRQFLKPVGKWRWISSRARYSVMLVTDVEV